MSGLQAGETVIDDSNFLEHTQGVVIDGEQKGFGMVMRDYNRQPFGSIKGMVKFDMPIIPRVEWSSRIKDMIAEKSMLSDFRNTGDNGKPIKSTDQGNKGYCWAHSPVSAVMLARARDNQPYVRPSAYAIACIIKNYRDQGGWNPEAVEFIANRGVPTVNTWPEKSMAPRNDNAATWADAARFKVTEGFMDMNMSKYDRNLNLDQLMTCLLSRIPCPIDLYWWGHSICAMDPLEIDSSLSLSDVNRWGGRIWNSWTDLYENNGTVVLRGNKFVPDGASALKVMTLAA